MLLQSIEPDISFIKIGKYFVLLMNKVSISWVWLTLSAVSTTFSAEI